MATYRMYYEYCQQGGIPCVSSTTFWRAIALRPRGKQIRAREGARAAYQHEFWLLEEMTPPHGDFPLHIVHFDHTQLDIMLRDDETGEVLGKPYLSLAVDAYTRRILAMELCFDAPSTYTCLRLFRDLCTPLPAHAVPSHPRQWPRVSQYCPAEVGGARWLHDRVPPASETARRLSDRTGVQDER